MTTHKTLDAARDAARANPAVVCLIEIDHATEGRCYIGCKTRMSSLAAALRSKPMPAIVRLVAEHQVKTPEEVAAERSEYLRTECKCERCREPIDGNTAYSQQEWSRLGASRIRVTAYYCGPCRHLLSSIGAGERTDLQARAGYVPPAERYTKED